MADYFYSLSKSGFYIPSLHANLFVEQVTVAPETEETVDRFFVPDPEGPIADAIGVTVEEHIALRQGEQDGKQISVVDGRVMLVDRVVDEAALWQHLQGEARAALQASDLVVLRCYESGVPFPVEWATYRESLREIIRADAGEVSQQLPLPPDYPAL